MKKHILIVIPCFSLLLLSGIVLFHSVDSWYRYAQAEKVLDALKPIDYPKHFTEYLEGLGESDNKLALVTKIVESAEEELKTKHDFEMQMIVDTKNKFITLIILSSALIMFSFMLLIGLVPHFKGSSNTQFNQDAAKNRGVC